MSKKTDRLGETSLSKEGCVMKILEYSYQIEIDD